MANALSGHKRRQPGRPVEDPNARWRALLYKAQERTAHNKGIYCVFRACTSQLDRRDITIVELPLDETSVPIEPGEELASSVLDITSEKGQLKFPHSALLAMPTLVENHNFYAAVAKFRVDDSHEWTTVPAKKINLSCCYKDLRECELPPFRRIRVAIFRTVLKESKVIQQSEGGSIRSSVEPKISIDFPKDAFSNDHNITISVRQVKDKRIATLKRHVSRCEKVMTASDFLCVENMVGLKKPVRYTMPAVDRQKKGKMVQNGVTPDMQTWLVQQSLDSGDWKVCTDVEAEPNKDGVISVKSAKPVKGMVVMKMASNARKEDAELGAKKLNQHLDEHVVQFIQKQKKEDHADILTDCVRTEESDHVESDMRRRGFTVGQEASKELLVREGKEIKMTLQGDICRLDYGDNRADGTIVFVYHSKYKSCRRQFSVEPVHANESGENSHDFYFGRNEYFIKTEKESIHQFEIKIPKTNVSLQEKGKKRETGDCLVQTIFKQIAQHLKDEWTSLASELEVDAAQIAKIQGEKSLKDRPAGYSMLYEWFMATNATNKLDILYRALRRIHKKNLADLVPDVNMTNAFFFVKDKAAGILSKWKTMGRYLNVHDSDIEAIDIDERNVKDKVWKVLTMWKTQAKGGATVGKLIEVMRKMEMNKTADGLKQYKKTEHEQPCGSGTGC